MFSGEANQLVVRLAQIVVPALFVLGPVDANFCFLGGSNVSLMFFCVGIFFVKINFL